MVTIVELMRAASKPSLPFGKPTAVRENFGLQGTGNIGQSWSERKLVPGVIGYWDLELDRFVTRIKSVNLKIKSS